jgi:hypothetical protein
LYEHATAPRRYINYMQTTNHILMIRPVQFTFNEQTAVNNAFQVKGYNGDAQLQALDEFDQFVAELRMNGVDVLVVNDTAEPHTPDSIFPNNWISFHDNGTVVLYPMYAENRRNERKPEVIAAVQSRFRILHTLDLSHHELHEKFLEGTGSMVLDRDRNIAYACISPRTDRQLFYQYCEELHFHAVAFRAVDFNGAAIYHTNVMMCVGDRFVVICLDSIPDHAERTRVEQTIINSGKEIIRISMEQMSHFAGNMLQLHNRNGEKLLVMSTQAFESLTDAQLKKLRSYNTIIHSSLLSIETNGGGSARCMMAEIHLRENLPQAIAEREGSVV